MKKQEKIVVGVGIGLGVVILLLLSIFSESEPQEFVENESISAIDVLFKEEDLASQIVLDAIKKPSLEEDNDYEQAMMDQVDNAYIQWQQKSAHEKEIKQLNQKFIYTYYSNEDPAVQNAQMEKMMVDHLFEEMKLPVDAQLQRPSIDSLMFDSFIGENDSVQATMVNVVDLVVDHMPQKMLATLSFIHSENWLIDDVVLEVIHTVSVE